MENMNNSNNFNNNDGGYNYGSEGYGSQPGQEGRNYQNQNTQQSGSYDQYGQNPQYNQGYSQPRYNYSWNSSQQYQQPQKKKGGAMKVLAVCLCLAVFVSAVGLIGYGGYSIYRDILNPSSAVVQQGGASAADTVTADDSLPSLTVTSIKNYSAANNPVVREGEPLTGTQIIKKVKPSVVGIVSSVPYGQIAGSAIIMTEDGYIITNQHLVDSATAVKVVFEDGTEYDAEIIGQDAKTDLAVVKIDATGLTPAEFGDSTVLEEGEPVIAIGNPTGLKLFATATSGIVSAVNREITVDDRVFTLIQTDAAINSGNSGGPLINQYGQVIGINSIKIATSSIEGLGFAIPISEAQDVINSLIKYGYVRERPVIGITGANINERAAIIYNMPRGVYVEEVSSGSGASAAGLQPGDIITGINGKTVATMSELNIEKGNFKAGDTVTLTVYREGRTIDLNIVLSEEKP